MEIISKLIIIFGGMGLYMFGAISDAMYLLAVVIFLDFCTGTLKALYHKELNSTLSRNGIIRKIGMIVCIAVIYMIDTYMGSGTMFRDMAVNMFIVSEIISNLENLSKIDVLIPSYLKQLLSQYTLKPYNRT